MMTQTDVQDPISAKTSMDILEMSIEATDDYQKQTKWAQFIRTIQTDATTLQFRTTNGMPPVYLPEVPCVLSGRHLETVFTQKTGRPACPVLSV